MTSEKRLFRSRTALLGGVCAGMSGYFNVDPLVVRIMTVLLTIISAGVLAVVYAVLWIVLPLEPKEDAPFDVQPQSVHSETYGPVDVDEARRGEEGGAKAPSPAQAASWRYANPAYTSSGHVPPEPPAGAVRAQDLVPSGAPDSPYPAPPSTPAPEGWPPAPVAPRREAPAPQPLSRSVKVAIWVGAILLFFGVSAQVASMVEGAGWWQYWPLIFVILGIVRMVVPGEEGHRMRKFVDGMSVFCVGVVLLMMSLDIIGWQSVEFMLMGLWPLLLVVVGLLVLGNALKSPAVTLLAGACFVAFCVIGVVWYSVPGEAEEVVVSMPYGREYHFDMLPWQEEGPKEPVATRVACEAGPLELVAARPAA